MSETRTLVKCVLGFLVAILVVAGGIFGFDIKVDVTDAPAFEEDVASTEKAPVDTTVEVEDTENSPADSTPTEDNQPSVDESVQDDVATSTDNNETIATEGETENA